MIVLRLKGGLGNQLFQLVAAHYLAQTLHRRVFIDKSCLSRYSQGRTFDAAKLIDCNDSSFFCGRPFQERFLGLISGLRPSRLFPFLGLSDKDLRLFPDSCALKFKQSLPLLFIDSYMLSGWSKSLFREALRQVPWLQREHDTSLLAVAFKEVAIHVRGGDFLRLPAHNICSYNYYCKCVNLAILSGYSSFVIVTDDTSHGASFLHMFKRDFPHAEFRQRESSGDSLNDFFFLKNSFALIAGNSTFAFWANALSSSILASWSSSRFSASLNKPFRFNSETWVDL
jgi:hypothetical protein